MKKIKTFLVCLTLSLSLIPTNVKASQEILSAKDVSGTDYTTSAKLASKLDVIFDGKAGLYSGSTQASTPLGCSKLTESNRFTVKNATTGEVRAGWQCYIYANAVYNTLFNECILHGDGLKHSQKIITQSKKKASYKRFTKLGVRCGAYMRASVSSSGCFNSNGGHSLIILSYNKSSITYLEANGNGRGLVHIITSSWKDFNAKQLSGHSRRIYHLVQPSDSYYDKLYNAPAKAKITNLSVTEDNTTSLTWKKQSGVTGYQIVYATDKKFTKNVKKVKVKASVLSKVFTTLQNDQTYYFKIRAYNKPKTKKIYGEYSAVKKINVIYNELPQEEPEIEETTAEMSTEEDVLVEETSVNNDTVETAIEITTAE